MLTYLPIRASLSGCMDSDRAEAQQGLLSSGRVPSTNASRIQPAPFPSLQTLGSIWISLSVLGMKTRQTGCPLVNSSSKKVSVVYSGRPNSIEENVLRKTYANNGTIIKKYKVNRLEPFIPFFIFTTTLKASLR